MDLLGMEIIAKSINNDDEASSIVDDFARFAAEKAGEYYERGFREGMDLIVREVKEQSEKGYEIKTIIESIESNQAFMDLMKK